MEGECYNNATEDNDLCRRCDDLRRKKKMKKAIDGK